MGKKQHYISQFYLKNFSDKSQKSIGLYRFEGQIFVENASIKDIAYRNNFYDDDNSIENALTNMEGRWNKILNVFIGKNISADTFKWIVENRTEIVDDIFHFFVITKMRTAQKGDSQVEIMRAIENRVGNEMSSDTHNQYFGYMPEIEKHPSNMSMKIGLESIPFYAGLDLLVIYNFSNIKFITSDVPIFSINPYYDRRQYNISYGLASMGLQEFLPISGEVCLCLYDRNIYLKACRGAMYSINSGHIIHLINQLAVQNAYEQIFFHVGESEKYIRTLCQHRKSADNRSRVKFLGGEKPVLIQSYEENIHSLFLLPCFKIKKSSMRIPLPTHMGGLIRPEVRPLYDMRSDDMTKFNR